MNPRKLFIPFLILLLLASRAAAVDVLLIGGSTNVAYDLVQSAGWSTTVGATTNASALNAYVSDRTKERAYLIPCGRYELTESIVLGPRTGYVLAGGGGTSRDLLDTEYVGATTPAGGPVARLVWQGNSTAAMIRLDGGGAAISNLHFQASEAPFAAGNEAKIGIHVNTSTAAGTGSNPAKCWLEHLSFYNVHTGILAGTSLTGGASDLDDDHADSIVAGDLTHYYPFSGANENVGTCVHIRGDQAVANNIQSINCFGAPAQVLYVERGGKTKVGSISVAADASGTTTAVRVGRIGTNQCNLSVDQVNIDATSTSCKLLVMDTDGTPDDSDVPIIEIGSAAIPSGNVAPILVDARAGSIYLKNVKGLTANSIRMIGYYTNATTKRVCNVHLENCGLALLTTPENLVSVDSTGPYRLVWKECFQNTDGVGPIRGRPFADGETSRNINTGTTPLSIISTTTSELTIASGVVTASQAYHTVDTESDAGSDDLDTINGGDVEGERLTLRASNSARTVVVKDATGNIQIAGDCTLDNAQDTIDLMWDGTSWLEVTRANSGAFILPREWQRFRQPTLTTDYAIAA